MKFTFIKTDVMSLEEVQSVSVSEGGSGSLSWLLFTIPVLMTFRSCRAICDV